MSFRSRKALRKEAPDARFDSDWWWPEIQIDFVACNPAQNADLRIPTA
jgi:hypothetical protein